MRKVLLTGPPGTGKTSILMALATELGRDLPVVLAGEDQEVVVTCAKAAAQQRPCIVMVEEMDMLVQAQQRGARISRRHGYAAQSGGHLPDRHHQLPAQDRQADIEAPGPDRPGDRGRGAAQPRGGCGRVRVLPEDVSLPAAELGKALDRTTPAEIREIIATAIRLCLPEPGQDTAPPLDIAMIERARAHLKHMIKTAEQLADDTPEEREELHGRLGPLDDDIPF